MTAIQKHISTLNIQELAAQVIEKAVKAGASAADAIVIDGTSVSTAVRHGNVESLERSESTGIGLRVFTGKKQAMVSASDFRPQTLNELVERAVFMAKLAPDDPYASLAPQEKLIKNIPELDLYDPFEPSTDRLLEEAKELESLAVSQKGITNSEGADASYSKNEIALATSDGFVGGYYNSSHSRSVSVLVGEGTGMERDYGFSASRHLKDLKKIDEIADEAVSRALRRLNPRKAKTATVPVIFDKRVSRELLGSLAGAINGASIARGTSFLKNAMGEQIFPKNMTIINDPLKQRGLASKPFDGEAVQTQTLEMVKDGVLNQWFLAMHAANQLGLETNGCASRGLSSAPGPSPSNFYMQNGDISFKALVGEVENGLYLTETFGMGINLVTGDYSQGAAGFWIENGEITYPVSEITIAGHLKEMFASLVAANDLEFQYSTNAPTVRVEKMTVAGA